jgi:hypothetical protein
VCLKEHELQEKEGIRSQSSAECEVQRAGRQIEVQSERVDYKEKEENGQAELWRWSDRAISKWTSDASVSFDYWTKDPTNASAGCPIRRSSFRNRWTGSEAGTCAEMN